MWFTLGISQTRCPSLYLSILHKKAKLIIGQEMTTNTTRWLTSLKVRYPKSWHSNHHCMWWRSWDDTGSMLPYRLPYDGHRRSRGRCWSMPWNTCVFCPLLCQLGTCNPSLCGNQMLCHRLQGKDHIYFNLIWKLICKVNNYIVRSYRYVIVVTNTATRRTSNA